MSQSARRPSPLGGCTLLFGSGEIAPGAQRAYRALFAPLPRPIRVSILETPAGFEVNSHWVACRVANYLEEHLRNFVPEVMVLPARKLGTESSPNDPQTVAPLLQSRVMYLGAGSPTYAVRQLRDTLAWHIVTARHRVGASVVLASASVLAASAYTLPVYEIFKVGEDPHWKPGLDFLGPYGLSLALVPHWNNTEGGANLDTSRCFMGRSRFGQLLEMLPTDVTVVGIDERTALMLDLQQMVCHIFGPGSVTLVRDGEERFVTGEQSFPISELGPFRAPARLPQGIPDALWNQVEAAALADSAGAGATAAPPAQVLALVEQRRLARVRRDWTAADAIRDEVADLGWRVRDTPDGPVLSPMGGSGHG